MTQHDYLKSFFLYSLKMFLLRKNKGFTLTELMVVIGIILIISLISVPSYSASIKKAKYEDGVSTVINLIKDARNTSIVGTMSLSGADLITLKGGYGIYLQTGGTLIYFQDLNENALYDASADTTLSTYLFPEEMQLKTMSGTKAVDYTGTDTSENIANAIILFKPPQGETVLNENSTGKTLLDLFIGLERYDGNKSKRLKINKISGYIETE